VNVSSCQVTDSISRSNSNCCQRSERLCLAARTVLHFLRVDCPTFLPVFCVVMFSLCYFMRLSVSAVLLSCRLMSLLVVCGLWFELCVVILCYCVIIKGTTGITGTITCTSTKSYGPFYITCKIALCGSNYTFFSLSVSACDKST